MFWPWHGFSLTILVSLFKRHSYLHAKHLRNGTLENCQLFENSPSFLNSINFCLFNNFHVLLPIAETCLKRVIIFIS